MTDRIPYVPFTKEMRKTHTILIPNMMEIHFELVRSVLLQAGYKAEILKNEGDGTARTGQRYVHNDTCYPALLVIGQLIEALEQGLYDPDRVAFILPQTAGGCRASNYIFLARKALRAAGYPQIPLISLNLNHMEEQEGFHLSLPLLQNMLASIAIGDLLMLLSNQTRPYEVHPGAVDALTNQWIEKASSLFSRGTVHLPAIKTLYAQMVEDYGRIETEERFRIRTGIVGEIYVKYAPLANNHLREFLERHHCEVMVPGLMQFLLYTADMPVEDARLYGTSRMKAGLSQVTYGLLERYERAMMKALAGSKFVVPAAYQELKALARPYIGTGCKMGEGWLLTAEMIELVEKGYGNVVCAQPFGCLPNHIAGKAMMHKIRQSLPASNIVAIDYDPGASRVNQENRIKLMLEIGREQALETARNIR